MANNTEVNRTSLQATMEVERLVNLIRGFGWNKIIEEIDGDVIVLKIQKSLTFPPSAE